MEYHSKDLGDKILLDHLAKVCQVTRDCTSMNSPLLLKQWKLFQYEVDDWYAQGYISLEAYNKACDMIDFLLHMKERIKEYEEENPNLHICR